MLAALKAVLKPFLNNFGFVVSHLHLNRKGKILKMAQYLKEVCLKDTQAPKGLGIQQGKGTNLFYGGFWGFFSVP